MWPGAMADYAVAGTALAVSESFRSLWVGIRESAKNFGTIHIRVDNGSTIFEENVPATFGFMNTVRFIGRIASNQGNVSVDCLDAGKHLITHVLFPLGNP